MKCQHCAYKPIGIDREYQMEVCTICGDKKRYKTVKGKIDNARYLKDHARDFAQPGGATNAIFQKYYGKK